MSDQQAMMVAQQNPELAQHVIEQNPQIMPGAMAAATSGTNAPNVSPMQQAMSNPKLWQGVGGIGQMMQKQQQHGALMQAPAPLMPGGSPMQQQGLGRPQMGALYQARPSRIY